MLTFLLGVVSSLSVYECLISSACQFRCSWNWYWYFTLQAASLYVIHTSIYVIKRADGFKIIWLSLDVRRWKNFVIEPVAWCNLMYTYLSMPKDVAVSWSVFVLPWITAGIPKTGDCPRQANIRRYGTASIWTNDAEESAWSQPSGRMVPKGVPGVDCRRSSRLQYKNHKARVCNVGIAHLDFVLSDDVPYTLKISHL